MRETIVCMRSPKVSSTRLGEFSTSSTSAAGAEEAPPAGPLKRPPRPLTSSLRVFRTMESASAASTLRARKGEEDINTEKNPDMDLITSPPTQPR